MIKHDQKGFTVIELMFATVVFSLVLMLCLNAVIQIGGIYNKGVTSARTQEAARTILEEITKNIQFSGGEIRPPSSPAGAAPHQQVACVGDIRITFAVGYQLKSAVSLDDSDRKHVRHVIWLDDLTNCNSRGAELGSINLTQTNPGGINGRELLSENMRLTQLQITDIGDPGLWKVDVGVVYGDSDLLEADADDGGRIKCNPRLGSARQYCAASYLSSTVQRRVE